MKQALHTLFPALHYTGFFNDKIWSRPKILVEA